MENNQKELVLLEDLGVQYPTLNSNYKKRYGLYKCHCGQEFKAITAQVKNKHIKSCGCSWHVRHGLAYNPLYKHWNQMIHRCNDPKSIGYKNYNEKGITVCDRWLDVTNFIEDMMPNYQEGLTLDRKNNDLGYSKDNCRWATRNVQQRNKRVIQRNNKTGYKGVHICSKTKKYKARIKVNSKTFCLGSYIEKVDAALAYNRYVIDNNLEHTLNEV